MSTEVLQESGASNHSRAYAVMQANEELRELRAIEARAKRIGDINIFGTVELSAEEVTGETLASARSQIAAAKSELDNFGRSTMTELMTEFELSGIFQVSIQGRKFTKQLLGRRVTIQGKEYLLNKELIDLITINLTVGTPPVTTRALNQFRSLLLGHADPSEIKEFAGILDLDERETSLLVDKVARAIELDTHYMTGAEEDEHLRESHDERQIDFLDAKYFSQSIVSGGPKIAEKLIRKYLYREKTDSITTRPYDGKLSADYITTIHENPGEIYILHIDDMPQFVLDDPRWQAELGRIIFIDNTEASKEIGLTYVYTFFSEVTEALTKVHTNIAGRPSSTQMVLREIVEEFTEDTIDRTYDQISGLLSSIETKISNLSYRDQEGLNADDEEAETLVADLFALRQFMETLELIRHFKKGTIDEEGPEGKTPAHILIAETKRIWFKYLYRRLKEAGYSATIGNGGGREGLHTAGKFLREELRTAITIPRRDDVRPTAFERVTGAGRKIRREVGSVLLGRRPADAARFEGAGAERRFRSPRETRERSTRRSFLVRTIRNVISGVFSKHLDPGSQKLKSLVEGKLETILRRERDPEKLLESIGSWIEEFFRPTDEDRPDTGVKEHFDRIDNKSKARVLKGLKGAYRILWDIINDVSPDPGCARGINEEIRRTGNIAGRIISEEIMWSYGNVYEDRDGEFPKDKRIMIKRKESGELDTAGLRTHLMQLERKLDEDKRLFRSLCKSMMIVINSPHNPSAQLLNEKEALAVLDVACDFGLTIIDDSSYYKMVRTQERDDGTQYRPHHPPIAEIYEQNKELFTGRHGARIITIATPTKNLSAAGGRQFLMISNDSAVTDFAQEELSGEVPNLLAYQFTKEKCTHGDGCKKIYKDLAKFAKRPRLSIGSYMNYFEKNLTPHQLIKSGISHEAYKVVVDAYYHLCLLTGRSGGKQHAEQIVHTLCKELKGMRPEKVAAADGDKRFEAAVAAIKSEKNARGEDINYLEPEGAFYVNIELDHFPRSKKDPRIVQQFIEVLNKRTGVGVTQMGSTHYLRLALGGKLEGDDKGYKVLENRVRIAVRTIYRYWGMFNEEEKYPDIKEFDVALARMFKRGSDAGEEGLREMLEERNSLVEANGAKKGNIDIKGGDGKVTEGDIVYKIEDKSEAVNIIIRMGSKIPETPEEMMDTQEFQVLYEFLLRNFYKEIPELQIMNENEVLSHFSVEKLKRAFSDDPDLPQDQRDTIEQICILLQSLWYCESIRTHVMMVCQDTDARIKMDAISASDRIGRHIQTIFNKISTPDKSMVEGEFNHGFASGYEVLKGIEAHDNMPEHAQVAIENSDFVGQMTSPRSKTSANTGATKRRQGRAFAFQRKTGNEEKLAKEKLSSDSFKEIMKSGEYVAVAVRVGPTKQLVVMHKSNVHLLRDLSRLFPQLAEVTDPAQLNKTEFDSVLYFGLPKKLMGEHQMSGYINDNSGGKDIKVGWVARSDDTDYVGFMKKMLLTMHNEKMIEMGAVPIHGSMFKLKYNDGRTFTIVGSADSGAGKSEMIAKIIEMIYVQKGKEALKGLEGIEIIAGDMLSLHEGLDGKIYALGTETGDFTRMDDLLGTPFEKIYAHLLEQGSVTNPGVTNERVTVPNICDAEEVLTPTRVDGIFYFNNYEDPKGGSAIRLTSVEEAFDQIIHGYRVNKGTSGDLPDFDACILHSRSEKIRALLDGKNLEETSYSIPLAWNRQGDDICVGYRDGESNTQEALQRVKNMFVGERFYHKENAKWASIDVEDVEYNLVDNSFSLIGQDGERVLLTIDVFSPVYDVDAEEDQWLIEQLENDGGPLYERIVKTYFSSVFGHTSEGNIGKVKRNAEKIKAAAIRLHGSGEIQAGVIFTQLARMGMEHEGPRIAGREIVGKFAGPEFKTKSFQARSKEVREGLKSKLEKTLGGTHTVSGEVLPEVVAHNIREQETRYNRAAVLLTAGINTPKYNVDEAIAIREEMSSDDSPAKYDLVPPIIRNELGRAIDRGPSTQQRFIERTPARVERNMDHYRELAQDSIDSVELTYRIMLHMGWIKVSTPPERVVGNGNNIRVQIAAKVAKQLKPDQAAEAA